MLANTKDGQPLKRSNLIVRDFLRKYNLDLIEIPEQFKDVEVDDRFQPKRTAKQKKTRVFTRTNKNLAEYDAWRCADRELLVTSGKDKAVCKLMLAPALLKQAFG